MKSNSLTPRLQLLLLLSFYWFVKGSPLPSSAYVDIVDIGNVKVKKIVTPRPGTYFVSFSSSADHTLKISGNGRDLFRNFFVNNY